MNDNCFDALAHEHRRRLLLDLLDENPEQVGTRVSDGAEPATSESAQELQILLHHVHLPKLESYGFVRRKPDSSAVVAGPRFDEIRPLLEFLGGTGEREV